MSRFDTTKLSTKHRKTLDALFEDPVRSDVRWNEVESLLSALGGQLSEGRGSRVRVILGDVRAVFHRPHAGKDTEKGAVRSVRRFLQQVGVKPHEDPDA